MADFLPFTFWTDLGYKEPPPVILTEGGIFTENNYSINWNYLSVSINTALHGEPSAPAKFSGAAFK
ncbi:MAG: hypothetical protein IJN18_06125, partial [Clostridia bacterium]|nr:hypothetical protein [Clostridia bacterium]